MPILAEQRSFKPLMKRSVAKRTQSAAMVDNLLIKGEAKDVVIRVNAIKTTAATMIHAAMMAAAMIAAVMTSAAITVPVTATGVTTSKAAPIIKGVASAMTATMTVTTLTISMTGIMLHEAPLARAHIAAPGVVPKTPTDPATLANLIALIILM